MTQVIVHIDCQERFRFYCRLLQALPEVDWHFITGRLSLYRAAKAQGLNCHWLRGAAPVAPMPPSDSLEARLSWRKPTQLAALHNRVWHTLAQLDSPDCIYLLWNGCRAVEKTMADFARHGQRSTLFLELGNFPQRLFADAEGVNALSRLARQPTVLDELPDDIDSFNTWRRNYFAQSQIPAQSGQVRRINTQGWQDQIGYFVGGHSSDQALWKRAQRKWQARRRQLQAEERDPALPFLLYPMQVSTDSQLVFNSDIDNSQALEMADDLARQRGLQLWVKPHPAEPDSDIHQHLIQQCKNKGWHLTLTPVPELLHQAEAVVTINSTVGLEAMLLEKPLTVLGRSHYDGFTSKQLRQYIMHYLLPIDYFSKEAISPCTAKQLLSRAEVSV